MTSYFMDFDLRGFYIFIAVTTTTTTCHDMNNVAVCVAITITLVRTFSSYKIFRGFSEHYLFLSIKFTVELGLEFFYVNVEWNINKTSKCTEPNNFDCGVFILDILNESLRLYLVIDDLVVYG